MFSNTAFYQFVEYSGEEVNLSITSTSSTGIMLMLELPHSKNLHISQCGLIIFRLRS